MWKCLDCEYENEESRRFCGGCGKAKDAPVVQPVIPLRRIWVKVRLIGDNIPLYATPNNDVPPVGNITDSPVAYFLENTDKGIEVKINDGREGFIFDSDAVIMKLWSLNHDFANVMAQPESSSSCITTLYRGDKFELFGTTVTRDGTRWVPVLLPDGKTGYVAEGTPITDHGRQFRIQKSVDDPGRYYVENDLASELSKNAPKREVVKQCPNCRIKIMNAESIPIDLAICTNCGAPLYLEHFKGAITCPSCKILIPYSPTAISPYAVVCGTCRKPLFPKIYMKSVKTIVNVICVLLVVAFLLFNFGGYFANILGLGTKPTAGIGQEKKNSSDNATMLWVPGASFTMGNADGVGDIWAQPAHKVTLSSYWIYKYDVTVAQYRVFCTETKHKLPDFPKPKIDHPEAFDSNYSWADKTGWDDPALQQHPIVNVSWYDAKAYADWAHVTLPTEAQWEYAARGPQGNNYPWGGKATKGDIMNGWDPTKCANLENSFVVGISTWPVGSFPAGASWCGAQDMTGNVQQWCVDWRSEYSATAVTNPSGPATGTQRMLRGGSWINYNGNLGNCSAGRAGNNPDNHDLIIGFRCVSLSPGP